MSKIIHNNSNKSRKTRAASVLSVRLSQTDSFSCTNTLPLYRFVYSSQISILVALLLFISFFVQGIQNAYASEEITGQTPLLSQIEPTAVVEETPEPPVVVDAVVADDVSIEPVQDSFVDATTSESVEIQTEIETIQSSSTQTDYATSSDEEEDLSDVATSSPDFISDVIDDESVDTSELEESVEPTRESVSVTESDSAFSFKSSECTQLATGSFYCQKPQKNILEDALFSAPDEDGDTEIFLVRAGVQTQITHNKVDDAAPYYDQNSNTIVWHRLINDRYQIISYDITTQEEVQLTQTSQNNMEPTRQGQYTVWQRWVDGGWNIVLHDGKNEQQITRTSTHNVAPYIHGSLIVWNKHSSNNEKTIEMYDMQSKTYVTVDDPDGMSVSNPRMVFVYDSLHPNGDIVTKGYDVLAHKFIDLDSRPRDLPDEIPESDSTGETRALIQSKPSIKSEIIQQSGNGSTSVPAADLPPSDLSVSTTSDEVFTLDLSTTTVSVDATSTDETEPSAVTEDNEVQISDPVVSELAPEGLVEDFEIEPFVMPVDDLGVQE